MTMEQKALRIAQYLLAPSQSRCHIPPATYEHAIMAVKLASDPSVPLQQRWDAVNVAWSDFPALHA